MMEWSFASMSVDSLRRGKGKLDPGSLDVRCEMRLALRWMWIPFELGLESMALEPSSLTMHNGGHIKASLTTTCVLDSN